MSLVQIYRERLPASYKLVLALCSGLVILMEASLAGVVLSDDILQKQLHLSVLSSFALTSAAFVGLCFFFECKISNDGIPKRIIKVRRWMAVAMYSLLLVTAVLLFLHWQFCAIYAFTVVNLTEYLHVFALFSYYTTTYMLVCKLQFNDR